MGNFKTILKKDVFLLVTASTCLMSVNASASDELNQYGLGYNGLTRSADQLSNSQFAKDFEADYRKYVSDQTSGELNAPIFELDVKYQDKSVNLSSPFHAGNSQLDTRFNNTSNEYKTRMGYQFKHIIPEASFNYSPDSYGLGGYYNYELGIAVPVKDVFSLETRYGWNKFDKESKKGGINDYQDWSVGVSTTYKGMKLKVDYIDMNASEKYQECGKLFACEGKTVFSIIKDF